MFFDLAITDASVPILSDINFLLERSDIFKFLTLSFMNLWLNFLGNFYLNL